MTVRLGLRSRQHTPATTAEREINEWTLAELAHKLDMPQPTLYAWLRRGRFKARRVMSQSHQLWLIKVTKEELMQFELARTALRRNDVQAGPAQQFQGGGS